MKTSFVVAIVQLIGALSGLLTIYFVAGDMGPETYALVGIYSIVSGVTVTFTEWGLETVLTRNALYWKVEGMQENIDEYVTQAILSRILGFLLLAPCLAGYLYFLDRAYYGGEKGFLFFLFLIGAGSSALNDSMSLMIRGQGGYIFSQTARTVNTYFLKFGGIGIYFIFGAPMYLSFYALSSVPLLCFFLIKLRHNLKRCYWQVVPMLKKILKAKYLWLKTDVSFLCASADSFFVSVIFPAQVMGTYTFYKALEGLAKSLIEGFFDVLSQQQVQAKGDFERMLWYERRFKRARNYFIMAILASVSIFIWKPDFFIRLANLGKYSYVEECVICISATSVLYLLGKYEINTLGMLAPTKLILYLHIVAACFAFLTFGIVWKWPFIYTVFLQRIVVFGVTSIIMIVFFSRMRELLYRKTSGI